MSYQSGCLDCFSDRRGVQDMYHDTRLQAIKLASDEQKKVAIYKEGQSYGYQTFDGPPPGGTIEVIVPGQ